jgi:hypothetical protein
MVGMEDPPLHRRRLGILAAAVVLVGGCREPQSRPAAQEPSPPSASVTQRRASDPDTVARNDEGLAAAELRPADILLQVDVEPTGPMVARRDEHQRHGRVPPITLYRDGTLVFATMFESRAGDRDTMQVYLRRIGTRRAAEIHGRALDRGAHELPARVDWCDPDPDPEQNIGASDQPYLVFLVRTPDKSLARSRVEGSCFPARDHPLRLTHTELSRLAVPSETSAVYRPDRASVWIAPGRRSTAARPWPLSAALLGAALERDLSVLSLDGEELERLITAVGSNNGGALLGEGERTIFVDVVPWLPGDDLSEAIAGDHRRLHWPR